MRIRALVLPALAAMLAGCGSDSGTPPTPLPTPTPRPVTTLLVQGSGELPAEFVRWHSVVSTVPGTLTVTVDWTHASNLVFVYVAENACTLEEFATSCPGSGCPCRFSVQSEARAPKPRVLTLPNAVAGSRSLFILNLGPTDESISYQVTHTTGTAAAPAPVAVQAGTARASRASAVGP